MDFTKAKKAFLVLADGTVFEGKSFGAEGTATGEVVFTTAMVGYQETLTDPCYQGQMVVQTFPLIGNYGTNDEDYASDNSVVSGYIVREYCEEPSNFRCTSTIDAFMKKHGIIGLYDIDTRSLTRIIREKGVMNGMITVCDNLDKDDALSRIASFDAGEVVAKVSVKENKLLKAEDSKFSVALIDFGDYKSYAAEFVKRGCNVTVMPYDASAEAVKAVNPDGIFLSDGPGNPEDCTEIAEVIKEVFGKKPIFATGLGHQLLAMANGAKIHKLPYGHRGANQPVKELGSGRVYITSQNHSYAVASDTLPSYVTVTYENLNDKSCEGIEYTDKNAVSIQFRPIAGDGPNETDFLYKKFFEMIGGSKNA